MSKSKKLKKVENQPVQEQVERQDVGNSEEPVPPTIVEAGIEEVFPNQGEVQEVVAEQIEAKSASKPKVSKRPYIQDVEGLLESGTHSRAEIIAFVLEKYPAVSKVGIQTFVTDLRNAKYSHFKDRKVVLHGSEGKLIFAGCLETVEEKPVEQPVE